MCLRKILIGLVLLAIAHCGRSQTTTRYAFSASGGNFVTLNNPNSPQLSGGNTDDGYFNNIPIGFDFWYMGTRYTTISASTNGWLTPGNTISDSRPGNSLSNRGACDPLCTQRKIRKVHLLSTLHRRFVGEDTYTCYVCRLPRIRERLTLIHQCRDKFMYEVRMGTAMSCTLDE